MQWDASLPNAGFTTGRSWLPTLTDTSVQTQDGDGSSKLSRYRRLLKLRRSNAALVQGLENVAAYGDVLTYERHIRRQPFFIALNIGAADADVQSHAGIVPLSTAPGRDGQRLAEGANRPAPAEALIASL